MMECAASEAAQRHAAAHRSFDTEHIMTSALSATAIIAFWPGIRMQFSQRQSVSCDRYQPSGVIGCEKACAVTLASLVAFHDGPLAAHKHRKPAVARVGRRTLNWLVDARLPSRFWTAGNLSCCIAGVKRLSLMVGFVGRWHCGNKLTKGELAATAPGHEGRAALRPQHIFGVVSHRSRSREPGVRPHTGLGCTAVA